MTSLKIDESQSHCQMTNHVVFGGQLLARTASRQRRHSTKAFHCPNRLFSPFAVIFKPAAPSTDEPSAESPALHSSVQHHHANTFGFDKVCERLPNRMTSIFARPLFNAAVATSAVRSFSTSTYRHGQRLVADRATVHAQSNTTTSAVAGAALAALTIAATATATKSNNAAALRRWYRTATSRSMSR
jgi:hypothetical protein